MAKLKAFSTYATKASGEGFTLKGDINVDTAGKFYFKLEQDHIPFAQRYIKDGIKLESNHELYIDGRNKNNLYSDNLTTLESALKTICYQFAQSGIKEELVIRYYISNTMVYFKETDGNIFPTKTDAGKNADGEWVGERGTFQSEKGFSLIVHAQVSCKITQSGSTTIKYVWPGHNETIGDIYNEHGDLTGNKYEFMHRLNRFVSTWNDEKDLKEMPYTEQRAKFFYELLLGMCRLADKFSTLEDHDTVLKLADSGKPLLLPGTTKGNQ